MTQGTKTSKPQNIDTKHEKAKISGQNNNGRPMERAAKTLKR